MNEDVETCATLAPLGAAAVLTEVDLEPVPEEQSIDVRTGELTLGSIHGMDAQPV